MLLVQTPRQCEGFCLPQLLQKCYCPHIPAWLINPDCPYLPKVTTMRTPASFFARSLTILLITLFAVSPAWATCGGGGGGGGGGMSGSGGGGGPAAETYPVPWKVRDAKRRSPRGLVLYWFPASKEELQKSSLRQSRTLSLYASQCVAMELADTRLPNADKLLGESKLPVAVLATPDGTPVSKVENKDGKLKVGEVEKVVDTEMKTRASARRRPTQGCQGESLRRAKKTPPSSSFKRWPNRSVCFPAKRRAPRRN